ncbi:MAG: polysaccharide biosynthesis/export family protein [Candidatus Aminicenantes bacterium]|nr:polysaccharide biosynthesis/export family protein [Candidatus Aminicenantes bacterium]
MKTITSKALIVLTSLMLVSCASVHHIYLVDLTAKEWPEKTEIVFTTSEPVVYNATKIENPPAIIINFPNNKIFSLEQQETIQETSPIKKIRKEYITSDNSIQSRLNMVIIEMKEDLPYRFSSNGRTIKLEIIHHNTEEEEISNKEKENRAIVEKKSPSEMEEGYLIGPRDVLNIEVWKHPDVSRKVIVNQRGEIRLPPIRKLEVLGMNVLQVEEKVTQALRQYLIDPIVFVAIEEYNSQRVIALGEIETGMYTLQRRTTLLEFMGKIGGPTKDADTFHIRLIKKDGRVLTYNLKELIDDPIKRNAATISAGDTVYVPPLEVNRIYILGEVAYPKTIPIKGKLTLIDAVTEAGGPTRDAVTKSVIVIRGEVGDQKGIRINLDRLLKEADIIQNIDLEPGDIVYVPKKFITNVERFLRLMSTPILFWLYTWII